MDQYHSITETSSAIKADSKIETYDCLIPPCIKHSCDIPKSIELRVAYDFPTNQSTYHYSVTWEDEHFDASTFGDVKKSNNEQTFSGVSSLNKRNSLPPPFSAESSSFKMIDSTTSTSSNPSFKYPDENKQVLVKLVFLMPAEREEMIYTYASLKINASECIVTPISKMMKENTKYHVRCWGKGTLYYAEPQPDKERKLIKISRNEYFSLPCSKLPMIHNSVVFVLDLGGYVKDGKDIYFD